MILQPLIECSRLVREPKINTKRRVHIANHLLLLGQLLGVPVQQLEILLVQLDQAAQVLPDALGRDRLGDDGASAGVCIITTTY